MELTVKSKRVNFQKLKAKVKKLSSILVTVVQIDSYAKITLAKIRKIETFSRTNLMVTAAWVTGFSTKEGFQFLWCLVFTVYTKVCKGNHYG